MTAEKIGRYEIVSTIGSGGGGMYTVYRAHDPLTQRDVAVKVLPQQFSDPSFRSRFERESLTIAQLEHPAIVPVYDSGAEENQLYLVSRYMTGGSLRHRLDAGPLPLDKIVEILESSRNGCSLIVVCDRCRLMSIDIPSRQ